MSESNTKVVGENVIFSNRMAINKDMISGTVLLCLSIGLILLTPMQVPIEENTLALSSRFFPYVILSLTGLLSLLLLMKGLKNARDKAQIKPAQPTSLKEFILFILVAVLILISAPYIGFTFSSMLGIGIIYWLVGIRNWGKLLLPAVLVPLAAELIFRYTLQVYLPLGFWEKILESLLY